MTNHCRNACSYRYYRLWRRSRHNKPHFECTWEKTPSHHHEGIWNGSGLGLWTSSKVRTCSHIFIPSLKKCMSLGLHCSLIKLHCVCFKVKELFDKYMEHQTSIFLNTHFVYIKIAYVCVGEADGRANEFLSNFWLLKNPWSPVIGL